VIPSLTILGTMHMKAR